MKALRATKNGPAIVDLQKPETDGEALVRVVRSGICSTDLEIIKGYADFRGTIGHEFVGIVESCRNDASIEGKRVVGEINVGCGNCEVCASGDERQCPGRTVLGIHGRDGSHAEFLTLPTRNLIEVPESVSDAEAVFAEPLAAAWGITERVEIAPEASVAVIGDGRLGLLCAFCLRLRTENIVMVGKHRDKLDLAQKRGIGVVELPEAGDLGRNFDVVVEASGSESGFQTALGLVRARGTIVLKSTFHGTPTWPASQVVVDEITVVGSRCGRMAPALELLADRSVTVDDMITDSFKLTNAVDALVKAAEPGVLKIQLSMS